MQLFKLKKIIIYWVIAMIFGASQTWAEPAPYVINLAEQRIPLSSFKGSWIFINYWASWCEPCVEEIVQFNRFYAANHAHQIKVFGVNQDGVSLEAQKQLVKKFDLRYPSLDPQSIKTLHLRQLSVVPVTYVLNPAGGLHAILYGGQTVQDFNEAMKSKSDL